MMRVTGLTALIACRGPRVTAMLYSGPYPWQSPRCPTPSMPDTPETSTSPGADEARHARLNHLLSRVSEGDRQAFSDFYKLTSSRVFAIIVRMIRDRGEAEDVLQNVYTSAWRRADSFDPARGNALTWLIALARNATIDRMRQHREAPLDEEQAAQIADDAPTPEDTAQFTEERRRLERCLETLEPTQRSSVREAFFSGATYSELAERLHVPLGTMKSWIRRSLMQLKLCLER
jgi:RNA polymerase sigma-70 factor, ECF subfamily